MLIHQAFGDNDLERAERLSHQVIEECGPAGARHPVGQALENLAYIANRRGQQDTAVELLHDAVGLYRDLDDPWQTAGTLADLAAQASIAGRGAEALQALAESTRLDEQVGWLQGQSNALAIAAVVHLARGETVLSISALGAYDAHPTPRPPGRDHLVPGFLAGPVETTRARLDPAAVAAATGTTRTRQIDDLIDELITQPAKAAK